MKNQWEVFFGEARKKHYGDGCQGYAHYSGVWHLYSEGRLDARITDGEACCRWAAQAECDEAHRQWRATQTNEPEYINGVEVTA